MCSQKVQVETERETGLETTRGNLQSLGVSCCALAGVYLTDTNRILGCQDGTHSRRTQELQVGQQHFLPSSMLFLLLSLAIFVHGNEYRSNSSASSSLKD